MTFILLLLSVLLFAWGSSLTQRLKTRDKKLKPIADAESYAKTTRKLADSDLSKAREEARAILENTQKLAESDLSKAREEAKAILGGITSRKQALERTIEQLNAQSGQAEAALKMINEGLRLKSDEAFLLEVGYYEPVYGFEDISRYAEELETIKGKQKQLLRINGEGGDRSAAAFATSPLTYNGSEADRPTSLSPDK